MAKKKTKALLDKIKRIRRIGRELHGRPGLGRARTFVDRKKESRRDACRDRVGTED